MLALIDYGLLLVFFLGVLMLVLIIARPQRQQIAGQKRGATLTAREQGRNVASPTAKEPKISFVVLMLFFLLLALVAFISAKQQTHTSSPSA